MINNKQLYNILYLLIKTNQQMKQKLFTLLMLALLACSGAWADDVIFSMTSVKNGKTSVSGKGTQSITATFNTGSSAVVYNGHADAKEMISSSGEINLGGSSGSYFHATFTTALAAGDIITSSTANTFYVNGTTTKGGSVSFPYTVKSTDEGLVGKTDLYVWKNSGSKFTSFTITRPTAAVPGAITFSPATGAEVAAESSITLSAENATSYKYKWTNSTATPSDGWSEGNTATVPAYGSENIYLHAYGVSAAGDGAASYAQYTITQPVVANPVFTTYGHAFQITCATTGAKIYYTIDDADPKSSASKAEFTLTGNNLMTIPASGTVYAYAEKEGAIASSVVSQSITVPTIGDVTGKLLMTMVPDAPGGDDEYAENTFTKAGYTMLNTSKIMNTDKMDHYRNMFKINAGTFTITPPSDVTIQSVKVYAIKNSNKSTSNVTVGDGYTVTTSSNVVIPRYTYYENGDGAWSQIVLTKTSPVEGETFVFTMGSQSRMYVEVYGTTSATSATINVAKTYTTYTPTYDLDFSSATELTAYIATAANASTVTMTQINKVPAGTPIVLKATSLDADIAVNVAPSTDDVSANKLKNSDGKISIGGSGNYDYILSDGKFYHASAGILPLGKCYLHLDAEPAAAANELTMDFGDGDVTGIADLRAKMVDVRGDFFNLAGQRVGQPTKGLYIVNGKKVIIK